MVFVFGDFPLGGRFKVYGDAVDMQHDIVQEGSRPSSQVPFQSSWSIPRPWQNHAGPSTSKGKGKPFQPRSFEPSMKRTIPYVSLCLDNTGKTIVSDATIAYILSRFLTVLCLESQSCVKQGQRLGVIRMNLSFWMQSSLQSVTKKVMSLCMHVYVYMQIHMPSSTHIHT